MRRLLVPAVAVVLLVASCGSDDARRTAPVYTPTFRAAACPSRVKPAPAITCGVLTVPENRAKPDGRQVHLAVERVRPSTGTVAPDPIIGDVHGGPGFRNTGEDDDLPALADTLGREVIVFDQRGTGASTPSLACPEDTDDRSTLALDAAGKAAAERRALDRCMARFRAAGVDLNQYRLSADAADAADLRRALHIGAWNWLGLSFGTDLGQAVLRDHPEGLRSVVLDSVVPIDDVTNQDHVINGQRAFGVLYAAHPGLQSKVEAWVKRLQTDPAVLHVDGTTIRFDADFAYEALYNALYDASLIPALPTLIDQGIAGDYSVIGPAILARLFHSDEYASGMATLMACADTVPFDDPTLVKQRAAEPGWAEVQSDVPSRADCARWGARPSPAASRRPVVSDVPVLVFTGGYDPVTPPRYGRAVASKLPHSQVVHFPNEGHGHYFTDCGRSLVKAFFDHPTAPVDGSCARAQH